MPGALAWGALSDAFGLVTATGLRRVAAYADQLKCGVGVIDIRTGTTVATLEFVDGVEEIFDVQVASINTLNKKGKTRRTRFGIGKRKDTKRAIVTLKSGSIDIFTAVG